MADRGEIDPGLREFARFYGIRSQHLASHLGLSLS